jgi:hypothetical protein
MPITMIARPSSNRPQTQVMLDRTPDTCPICHVAITPSDFGAVSQCTINDRLWVERVLFCPNEKCEHVFIARYVHSGQAGPLNPNQQFTLHSCVPSELVRKRQSENISRISPDFCNIYAEADKAEQYQLTLIAGPGYRKALEFLIKDYVISQNPETDPDKKAAHKDLVERQQLAACIKEHIKSEQIKEISKRAAWLGNDETHYIRKWEDKDLKDLKKLIALAMHWIEMETLTAEVISDMPEGKS